MSDSTQQPRRYTTYTRDGNQSDEAMMRRYNRWHLRFDQPDPYDGSYDLTSPQSINRYAYVSNDPVNLTDPTGLTQCITINTDDGSRLQCWDDGQPNRVIVNGQLVTDFIAEVHANLTDAVFAINSQFHGIDSGNNIPTIPAPKPPAPPVPCTEPTSGAADLNASWMPPTVLGYSGGVQVDERYVYPYAGVAAGTPNSPATAFWGGSVTAGKGRPSPGLNYNASVGYIFGISYSGKLDPTSLRSIWRSVRYNGSWSFGGTTPGASVAVTYMWRIRFRCN